MSEISNYETRITAALERIGRAVVQVEERAQVQAAAQAEGGIATEEMVAEMGRLQGALDTERAARTDMETQVRAIHQAQLDQIALLEKDAESLRSQLMVHDGELQKLRAVNGKLRENSAALRDVHASAVSDPSLINAALAVEVEALEVSRDADVAELTAIRNELRPFLASAPSTPEEA
jgi:hypothetical protein